MDLPFFMKENVTSFLENVRYHIPSLVFEEKISVVFRSLTFHRPLVPSKSYDHLYRVALKQVACLS